MTSSLLPSEKNNCLAVSTMSSESEYLVAKIEKYIENLKKGYKVQLNLDTKSLTRSGYGIPVPESRYRLLPYPSL